MLKIFVDLSWVIACAALGFIWLITLISIVTILNGGEFQSGPISEISITDERNLVAWTLGGTIVCIGVMMISALLRGVFETLVEGDPFVPENAQRFRKIALVLAVLQLSRMLINVLITAVMSLFEKNSDSNLTFELNINLTSWAVVMILVVLAQVFDEGARLREEQKMTI